MNRQPIAFFDVDKTICDCYCGYHTTRELIRRGIIKKRRVVLAVLYKEFGRLFKKVNVRRMYEIALADLAGTHIADIMQIGLEVFETKVKPTIYQEALREIEKCRQAGYRIALISSGPYMLVKNMEGFLGVDASFSNGPVVEGEVLQKTIQEPLCYEEGKVISAKNYAEENQVSLKDCTFYSDSISDLPLLSLVGKPIVVNPDQHLAREARRRDWPILKFRETLGSSAK